MNIAITDRTSGSAATSFQSDQSRNRLAFWLSGSLFVATMLWLVGGGFASTLNAATLAPQDDEPKPKAKLEAADIKIIRPLFMDAMKKGNVAGVRRLRETLEKWSKKKGVGSALADTGPWNELSAEYYTASLKGKKFKKGVSMNRVSFKRQGEPVEFEYALYVPKKYNHKEAWPVILCFHDRKSQRTFSNGKDYINKVWLANKATRAIADKFIIIAPTIGDTSAKAKGVAEREFKWFDLLHAQAMVRPLRQVQQNFHIDVNRVYLDGSGRGAEMALELSALFGIDGFAGVIARQGVLSKKHLIPGAAQIPTLLIHRKPHSKEKGGKERAKDWEDFKAAAAEHDWKPEILELDAPAKINGKVLAGQMIDPVWDATPQIGEFLDGKTLDPYPAALRIVSDNPLFRSGSYVRINGHDIGREENNGAINVLFEIDKEANAIKVTGDGIHGLSFFLNDSVLDLDRPVQVIINGIPEVAEIPARSVSAMIKSMQNRPFDTVRFNTTTVVMAVTTPEDKNAKADDEGEKKAEEN